MKYFLILICLAIFAVGCGMEGDYAYTQQEVIQEVDTDRIPELESDCPPCPRKCKPSCVEKCWESFQVCKEDCTTKCSCTYYCERAFKACWEECS